MYMCTHPSDLHDAGACAYVGTRSGDTRLSNVDNSDSTNAGNVNVIFPMMNTKCMMYCI